MCLLFSRWVSHSVCSTESVIRMNVEMSVEAGRSVNTVMGAILRRCGEERLIKRFGTTSFVVAIHSDRVDVPNGQPGLHEVAPYQGV